MGCALGGWAMNCSTHGKPCVSPAEALELDPLVWCMCGRALWTFREALALANTWNWTGKVPYDTGARSLRLLALLNK